MESCSINPLISFVYHTLQTEWASQVVSVVKNPPANAGDMRRRFSPWVGKIPWRRAWQPTPVFLPGKFHRQRSLEGYSPWGHKSQTLLSTHTDYLCTPKFTCQNLTPNVLCGGGAFCRLLCDKGKALLKGISVLRKDPQRDPLPLSPLEDTARWPFVNQDGGSHQTVDLLVTWSWTSQPPEPWGWMCVVSKSCSLWYAVTTVQRD